MVSKDCGVTSGVTATRSTAPHCIAVIHARGGSKRLPLKNIKPLKGRPLIAWCVEAALGAKFVGRVMVSTDHDGIAEAARAAGAEVPFRRPADLAEDVCSEKVTRHAVEWYENDTGKTVNIVVTIQPTTPFIRAADIDACVEALAADPSCDSAMTVGPVHERPEWMFRRDANGNLASYIGREIAGKDGISQTLEALYHPNGGVYATRRDLLFGKDRIIGTRPFGHVMSRLRSVDIDDPVDMIIAEGVANYLADHPED